MGNRKVGDKGGGKPPLTRLAVISHLSQSAEKIPPYVSQILLVPPPAKNARWLQIEIVQSIRLRVENEVLDVPVDVGGEGGRGDRSQLRRDLRYEGLVLLPYERIVLPISMNDLVVNHVPKRNPTDTLLNDAGMGRSEKQTSLAEEAVPRLWNPDDRLESVIL